MRGGVKKAIILKATVFYLFTGYTWLRSGHNVSEHCSPYLTACGALDIAFSARLLAVRPATRKAVVLFYCHPEARRKDLDFQILHCIQNDNLCGCLFKTTML